MWNRSERSAGHSSVSEWTAGDAVCGCVGSDVGVAAGPTGFPDGAGAESSGWLDVYVAAVGDVGLRPATDGAVGAAPSGRGLAAGARFAVDDDDDDWEDDVFDDDDDDDDEDDDELFPDDDDDLDEDEDDDLDELDDEELE